LITRYSISSGQFPLLTNRHHQSTFAGILARRFGIGRQTGFVLRAQEFAYRTVHPTAPVIRRNDLPVEVNVAHAAVPIKKPPVTAALRGLLVGVLSDQGFELLCLLQGIQAFLKVFGLRR